MSRDARLLSGLTLILVPTIVYGGLTMFGVLTAHVPEMRFLIYAGA